MSDYETMSDGALTEAGDCVAKLSGVSVSFDAPVLSKVSFSVPAGAITSLVGPNGAGKTTIFNTINGFIKPEAGHVFVAGQEITGWSPHQVANIGVGRLFQDVRTFGEFSVMDSVLVGAQGSGDFASSAVLTPWKWWLAKGGTIRRAEEALERVALKVDRDRLSGTLSYGQQKRLALARTLMRPCRLLLLDEPSAGLDEPSLNEVVDVISSLATPDRAILLIEHNRSVIDRLADRVVFLADGAVLAEGPATDIMTDPRLVERYLGQ